MSPLTKRRSTWIWIVTLVVALGSAAYQRMTGPTIRVKGSVEVAGERIRFRLPRSGNTTTPATVEVSIESPKTAGEIRYRRFRSHDEWTTEAMQRDGSRVFAELPKLAAAGKVMYEVTLVDEGGGRHPLTEEPVVLRYKGPVPAAVLAPHIIAIFLSMLLATRAGLEVLARGPRAHVYTRLTVAVLFVGGLILGPMVQKHAFGAYWTGWPFGHDLTDNKVAVAFAFWILALWRGYRPGRGRAWILTASIVQFVIFLIPHSMLGSEIDFTATSTFTSTCTCTCT